MNINNNNNIVSINNNNNEEKTEMPDPDYIKVHNDFLFVNDFMSLPSNVQPS